RHLDLAIPAPRGRREDLADPVGHDLVVRIARSLRHALAPPAGEIRNEDDAVADEVDLRLIDNPPAARTTLALRVGIGQLPAELRSRHLVPRRRPRLGVELTVEYLPDEPFGQRLESLVQGLVVCSSGHVTVADDGHARGGLHDSVLDKSGVAG